MKQLCGEILVPGDIVLTTTNAFVSKAIRMFTKSDISHAMICVEKYSVIDATGEGVQARNSQRMFFEDNCSIYILRLQNEIQPQQLRIILDHVRGSIGAQYTTGEAISARFGGFRDWSRKQFCSRLVAQAYHFAGIPLVQDANYCSPNDLKKSPALRHVEHSPISISSSIAAAIVADADTTELMRQVTNELLTRMRARDPRIEVVNDINNFLFHNPKEDAFVCRTLSESGYLDVWRVEMNARPFHYNFDLFDSMPDSVEDKRAYCLSVIANFENGIYRYRVNFKGYENFYRQTGLQAFRILENLYKDLLRMHEIRLSIAKQWLEANG